MSKVTFTVFSDLHYHEAWYKSEAFQRLASIQKRAAESGSAFLLHLGDFCHQPSISKDLIHQYKNNSIPGYFVLGNHEFDIDTHETVLQCFGLEKGYYYFDSNGFRFVVLDENYFRDFPGVYFHYSARNYFDHPASRDYMPPEEITWLEETLLSSPYPCILASHAPITYPTGSGMRCKKEVKAVLDKAQNTPGRVILCLNGHYHRSGMDIIDGVPRLDVNSASFNWIPKPHDLFPEKDWYKQYECVGNMVIYEQPLCADIFIDTESRTIEVTGTEGKFLYGISTEDSGNNSGARLCTPDMITTKVQYGA